MSTEGKNVQTEFEPGEYARLREIAEEGGISIKEALRRAASDWIECHDAVDADDPPFTFHDEYDVPTSGPTSAGGLDDELCGRSRHEGNG